MQPAIDYARDGHPVLPRVANTIAGLQGFFEEEWPTSAAVWAPGGRAPEPNELFKNPDLAATYDRLASALGDTREAQIDAARQRMARGLRRPGDFRLPQGRACHGCVRGQAQRRSGPLGHG